MFWVLFCPPFSVFKADVGERDVEQSAETTEYQKLKVKRDMVLRMFIGANCGISRGCDLLSCRDCGAQKMHMTAYE
jgi:hypothetical protein